VTQFAPAGSAQLESQLEAVLTIRERFRISAQLGSLMLASGLLAVAFLQQWFGDFAQQQMAEWLKLIAALLVSAPIFVTAVRGIFTREADDVIEQLVALAVLAALVSGEFTTAALVPIILILGHFLEQRSILGAQAAIDGLQTLNARKATLLTSEGEREIEPTDLRSDDIILVRPGDVLPADGVIGKGSSTVDQSSITGESLAEEVCPGMRLFAGSVQSDRRCWK